MTDRAPGLFIDAAELQARLGLTDRGFKVTIAALNRMPSFPRPDPLFEGKWYWPAVRRWIDNRYGLTLEAPTSPDIKGALDEAAEDRRHARPALADTGRRKLGSSLARTG